MLISLPANIILSCQGFPGVNTGLFILSVGNEEKSFKTLTPGHWRFNSPAAAILPLWPAGQSSVPESVSSASVKIILQFKRG
jgi:hypothetical protein